MSVERELRFTVFMMHILAAAWGKSVPEAYAICKKSGALKNYIIPHYEALHSLGSNALIEDLTGYILDRGYKI